MGQPAQHALYLIDASSYVYRAFFALPPLTNAGGLPINAVYGFTTMLLKLLKDVKPDYLAAIFDAPGQTFRDEVYADYKAHRPAMPDDLAVQFPLVREVTECFAMRTISIAGVEADDVIATIATRVASRGHPVVVITSDKDLMQIVGPCVRIWDTMKDRWFDAAAVQEKFGVGPAQIVDLIGLMGDSVDNIPGVKGVGEKTARVLLERFGSIDGILQQPEEVAKCPGLRGASKIAEVLKSNADVARMSRELARARTDADVDAELEGFRFQSPVSECLRPLFTRLGFNKLIKELSSAAPAFAIQPVEVGSAAQAAAVLAEVQRDTAVGFASTGADAGPATLLTHGEQVVVVPRTTLAARDVLDALARRDIKVVAHDLKRDLHNTLQQSRSTGSDFDVMLASYLAEASATHRLEDLAADLLGTHFPTYRADLGALASGVKLLLPLYEKLQSELRSRDLMGLFERVEMPLVGVLARMEAHGVRLDTAALAVWSVEIDTRLHALEEQIYALAGGPFNIGSPPQLREILFERLGLSTRGVRRGKTGLSTDVDVLTRLASEHALPAKILEFRGLAKLKSTYVDALPAAVRQSSGRLHTTFNQCVAATGRLSSSDPNLQNIPVRGEEGRRLRAAFIAAPDHKLLVADYSQIELRVLAHLSQDAILAAAFQNAEDIHARTAAEVFQVLPGAVTRDMRRAAKVINFGIIYGMGAQALARELNVASARAQQYIDNYFERHSGVRDYLEHTRVEARRLGYVTTILGRRRSLPELASRDRQLAQAAERTATNTPVQGSAADLIKLAMVNIDRRLQAESVRAAMILQVHDELVFEVHQEDCDAALSLVRKEMESVMPLKVPLVIDAGCGANWAEAHP